MSIGINIGMSVGRGGGAPGAEYIQRVAQVFGAAFYAHFPLNEPSGTVARDVKNGYTGTYSTVTLGVTGVGDGNTAARFNGTSSQAVLTSAPLNAAINGELFTLTCWGLVSGAGVWTDATQRELCRFSASGTNYGILRKTATSNQFGYFQGAGGIAKSVTESSVSPLTWQPYSIALSRAGDRLTAWRDGAPIGTVQTGIGAFVGPITAVVAGDNSGFWSGDIAHYIIGNMEANAGDIAILHRKAGVVAFEGDSRMASTLSVSVMADSAVAARRFGWANVALSGGTVAQMITDAPTQIVPLYRSLLGVNAAVVWGGLNDAPAGADAATIYARLVSECGILSAAGIRPIVCTEIDCQSVALNAVGWHSTIWPALNALINANWPTFAAAKADLGANANLQDANNTTYFNADKIHLTATGAGVAAGIIAAQVAAL